MPEKYILNVKTTSMAAGLTMMILSTGILLLGMFIWMFKGYGIGGLANTFQPMLITIALSSAGGFASGFIFALIWNWFEGDR